MERIHTTSGRVDLLLEVAAETTSALDAVLAGEPVSERQTPSIGCNIKWRQGNEPSYFG